MMRFTLIDSSGTISFTGPGHFLKALVAGCSAEPASTGLLLESVRQLDPKFVDAVRIDLARFDEHVVKDDPASIDEWLEREGEERPQVFRVFNQQLRNMSLEPERLGVVLFNLPEQRIIQIQNAYGEVLRQDRGRIRQDGVPVRRYYEYTLPDRWQLLP